MCTDALRRSAKVDCGTAFTWTFATKIDSLPRHAEIWSNYTGDSGQSSLHLDNHHPPLAQLTLNCITKHIAPHHDNQRGLLHG